MKILYGKREFILILINKYFEQLYKSELAIKEKYIYRVEGNLS